MKKFMKKNNKGFSLVELIVVVLIIAIIAVALAPQVTKWVNQARTNTTANNQATLQATVQTCVAEAMSGTTATPITDWTGTVTVTNGTAASTDVDTALVTLINQALANFNDTAHTYTVTIATDGSVSVQ